MHPDLVPMHGFTRFDESLIVIDLLNTGIICRAREDLQACLAMSDRFAGHATDVEPLLGKYRATYLEQVRDPSVGALGDDQAQAAPHVHCPYRYQLAGHVHPALRPVLDTPATDHRHVMSLDLFGSANGARKAADRLLPVLRDRFGHPRDERAAEGRPAVGRHHGQVSR